MQTCDLKPNFYALTTAIFNPKISAQRAINRFLGGDFSPSEQTIMQMKIAYRNGMWISEIADLYGISEKTAGRIINSRCVNH